jgi:penicillin-binding protein activator
MKTYARAGLGALLVATSMAAAGCAKQVTRISPSQAVDLSGRWNDVDSRIVADSIIRQSFAAATGPSWALRYAQAHGGRQPTVIVGTVRNRSMEHIPVGTFVRELERAYLNSGQVQVVASPQERDEVRDERADQQDNAAADTRARMGAERGANYMLQGDIEQISDREGRRSVVYYQVDMTLVDLETNQKAWVGQQRIKKYVEQPRFRI